MKPTALPTARAEIFHFIMRFLVVAAVSITILSLFSSGESSQPTEDTAVNRQLESRSELRTAR